MKANCSRPALQLALGMVTSVVSSRTPREVLKCVRLTAKSGQLVLAGTDLEVGIRSTVMQVEVEREGDVLLPADKISQIIHEMPDETVLLEVAEGAVHIRGKDSYFHVYGQDPAEFPPVPEFEGEADFEVEANVLKRLIETSAFAAARESTRYAINGVLWEKKGAKLQFVATDGRRLAKAAGAAKKAAGEAISIIVPSKTMALVLRVVQNSEVEEIGIRATGNQLLVRAGGTTVSSVLVEGHFPKYDDVIPRESSKKVIFSREELYAAVRQAALLTSDESKGIRLDFSPGKVVFSSRAPQQGEATSTMEVEYQGEPLAIGFNPGFLTDALKVVSVDKVQLELSDSNKPGVLTAGKEFTYVIMPVSLA